MPLLSFIIQSKKLLTRDRIAGFLIVFKVFYIACKLEWRDQLIMILKVCVELAQSSQKKGTQRVERKSKETGEFCAKMFMAVSLKLKLGYR